MRAISDRADGHRLRALIVLLWRAGLRISEALAVQESDLHRSRGAVLIRRGAVCDPRPDGWSPAGGLRGAQAAAPCRRRCGGETPLRLPDRWCGPGVSGPVCRSWRQTESAARCRQ
jgi:integrase